jgi:hypothetical protein
LTPIAEEEEAGLIVVRNADHMNVDFFRKHMEARHHASILRFRYIDWDSSEYLEKCWRAYHRQLHNLGLQGDLDHCHGR